MSTYSPPMQQSNAAKYIVIFAIVAAGLYALAGMPAVEATAEIVEAEAVILDTEQGGPEELASWVAAMPTVEVTGDHADKKHKEAEFVRQICKEYGPYQVWREKYEPDTFHILCMTPDGRLVDWIVRQIGRRLIERTAFMPRAGLAIKVIEYAASKGTRYRGGF